MDYKWTEVAPIDLLKITKLEGQPWLAVYHLVSKKEFRERYHLNSFRKGQLLRVRKYINDILLDQLPVLADIQRYMDELAISDVPEPLTSIGAGGVFMFQQVAMYREKLMRGRDWPALADQQIQSVFTMTDKTDAYLRRLAEFYTDDGVEAILEPQSRQPAPHDADPDDGEGAAAAELGASPEPAIEVLD